MYLLEWTISVAPIGLYIYGVSLNEKSSFSVARDFRVFTSSESIGHGRDTHLTVSFAQRGFFLLHPRNLVYDSRPRPGISFSQIIGPIRPILDRFSAATYGSPSKRLEEISARLRYERKWESGRRELFRVLFVDASDIKLTSNFLSRVVSLADVTTIARRSFERFILKSMPHFPAICKR